MTEYGLERRNGHYAIAKGQLADVIGDPGGRPTFLEHVARKAWVDSDDLATAWLVAMTLHGIEVPAEQVRKTIANMRVQGGEGSAEV